MKSKKIKLKIKVLTSNAPSAGTLIRFTLKACWAVLVKQEHI